MYIFFSNPSQYSFLVDENKMMFSQVPDKQKNSSCVKATFAPLFLQWYKTGAFACEKNAERLMMY